MEYCSRCRKHVNTRKQLQGCAMDPDNGVQEVKYALHCEECNSFIKSYVEEYRSLNAGRHR
jgi:ribosomal protein L33